MTKTTSEFAETKVRMIKNTDRWRPWSRQAGHVEKKEAESRLRRWMDRHWAKTFTINQLFLLALTIGIVGLWIPRWAGPLDLRWDGAVYSILGSSIAEGKGYRLLHEPGEIEAIQYPPLLPLLAAAPQMIFGTSDPVVIGRWLKLLFFFFHAGFVLATYFMLKMLVPRWVAFLAALALLLNVQVVFHSNLFFAEIPFGLVTVLFVLCNRRSSNPVYEVLAPVFAVTAFLLRAAGIALLVAWVAESLVRKQFKRAAVRLMISAIPVLCWNAYVIQVEGAPSYSTPAYPYQRAPYLNYNVSYATNLALLDYKSPGSGNATALQLARRFRKNILGMVATLGESVSEVRSFWEYQLNYHGKFSRVLPRLVPVPILLLGGLILAGLIILIRRGEVFIPVYILASVALLCATPWPEQFRRYLVPVAPFLLTSLSICLLSGSNWLRMSRSKLVRQCALIAPILVFALIFEAEENSLLGMYRYHFDRVRSETNGGKLVDYRLFYYDAVYKSLDDGLDWLKKNAKADDVVATGMPQWAYLRNGLKAVRPPLEANSERAQTLLASVPVAYVVLDKTGEGSSEASNAYMLPLLQGNPHAWKLVYADEKGGVSVYERVRAGGGNKGNQ
jgi:hypothetical protein